MKDFNYITKEIVPRINYRSELKELKSKDISGYSGSSKTRLIYVNISNSNDILIYDLTRCSITYYYEYLAVIRSCLN